MHLEISNQRRRAVIDGASLRLYVNRGKIRTAWCSIWTPIMDLDESALRRFAKAWVDKMRMPKDLIS